MAMKDNGKKTSKTTPVEAATPVTPAPETPATSAAADRIGAVAETLKNNKGLAAMFLRKSPLGLLAGAVLATKEGQQLTDQVIDKAAKAAGTAFESASTLAQKAGTVVRDTAADKIADKLADVLRTPKKDGDKGPKAP